MVVNDRDNGYEIGKSESVAKSALSVHKCPFCGLEVVVRVDIEDLGVISGDDGFPFPHLHLHGNPLHAMLCYVDKQGVVRTSGFVRSIEILRNSDTFQQLTKKFSKASEIIEEW